MQNISRTKEIGEFLNRPNTPALGELCTRTPVLGSGAVAVDKQSGTSDSQPTLLKQLASINNLYNPSSPTRPSDQRWSSEKEEAHKNISFTESFIATHWTSTLKPSSLQVCKKLYRASLCAPLRARKNETGESQPRTRKILQQPGSGTQLSESEAFIH